MATTIVDKHLARPKALEALLYLVEVGGASQVQIALALGAASKIVKTRAAALKALAQAVLGALALVLGLELRANAAACAAKDRRPQAPRPTVMAAATAAGAAGGEAGAAAVPPFDLLRALPQRRFPRLPHSTVPDTWLQSLTDNLVIGAAKAQWRQGRKAAAEQLISLLDGREALVPADYSALAQGLKKVLDLEMNLGVVSVAVRAVGALEAPLGKDFARHAKLLAPSLFRRGGERNTQVVDGVKATLDAIARAGCLPLADAIEATKGKEAAASTNPPVQSCAVRFVKECVACAGGPSVTKALGELSALLSPVTDASSPEARAAALPPREHAGKTERTAGTAGTAAAPTAAAASTAPAPAAPAPAAPAPAAPAPVSASAPAPLAKRVASGVSGGAPKPTGASAPKSACAPSSGGTSGGGGGGGAEAWTEPPLPSTEEYSAARGQQRRGARPARAVVTW